METRTQFPILKWAQRKDRLYITINVVHSKPPTIDFIEGKILKYCGEDGTKKYAFEIEFNNEVIKEESKYSLDSRHIFLNIKKKTSGPYWPRLLKDTVKYQWIQIDWAYYADEDEEEEAKEPNMEGQDFGGMGGGEMEDDEDDKEEIKESNPDCKCEHDHDDKTEEKVEEKKEGLADLDKEEQK